MTSSPAPIFSPPPSDVDALLHDLARPDISFLALAAAHTTTPEALSLWMIRPDIRDRLAAAADLIAWRTQFAASHVLESGLNVLREICTSFTARTPDRAPQDAQTAPAADQSSQATPPSTPPIDPERAATLRARRAETSRRAATTILRLTTLRSIGAPPIRAASSHSLAQSPPIAPPPTPKPVVQAPPASPASLSPSGPNPNHNPNPNRPLPLPSPRPLSPVSSLLGLVGATPLPSDLTFSPRDPFP